MTFHYLYLIPCFTPHLHYCNVVWDIATKTAFNLLVLTQKWIIGTLSNVSNHKHPSHIFWNSKILKITDIRKLECLKLIDDKFNRQNIIQLATVDATHNINTRNTHNLRPVFTDTQSQKRFITYHGCIHFNDLPDTLKYKQNEDTFKIKNKKLFIQYLLTSLSIE